MKKTFIISLMIVFLVSAVFVGNSSVNAQNQLQSGTLIKGKNLSAVYYIGEDGKKYVFPSDKIFYSWFDNFKGVKVIENNELSNYPPGGNVSYRPGVYLLKTKSSPRVYAVSGNGQLRWIRTEQLARAIYGENWNLLLDSMPDELFAKYIIGNVIVSENDFNPTQVEKENPSINHALGLKKSKVVMEQTQLQRRCAWLEDSISKIQKKLVRSGIKVNGIGGDYLNECAVESTSDEPVDFVGKKIDICHVPNGNVANAHTIVVGSAAAKAHLAHGDYLGTCSSENKDKGAPVITNILASPSATSSVISWTTNEPSDSKVIYATSPIASATNTMEIYKTTKEISHSITLLNLTTVTTYYYKIVSKDAAGNVSTSGQYMFTTGGDITAPVITNILASPSSTSSVISWTTNEPSDSKVIYAISPLASSSVTMEMYKATKETSHSITLLNLTTATTYYYKIVSKDAAGNVSTSAQYILKTGDDVTAPIITNVAVSPFATTSVITWTTDELSDSKVIYATSPLASATTTIEKYVAANVTSHSVTLTGLTIHTMYYFKVVSKDIVGNVSTSTQNTFYTQ